MDTTGQILKASVFADILRVSKGSVRAPLQVGCLECLLAQNIMAHGGHGGHLVSLLHDWYLILKNHRPTQTESQSAGTGWTLHKCQGHETDTQAALG